MLVSGTLWAAGDPLVGKWKVNPAKSKLTDEMKVEALGGNKYAITFAPGAVDAVVADGTDQPGMRGSTLAVTISGPNNWRVVRKKDGRMMVMGNWTLSGDGKRLTESTRLTTPTARQRRPIIRTSAPRVRRDSSALGTLS